MMLRLGLIDCLLGRHERSTEMAMHHARGATSRCRHCGVPMRKLGLRWEVVPRPLRRGSVERG